MKLEARDLHFAYDNGPVLADGIDLVLEPGCFTLLLGPNGCGKSTLFRMLTGEIMPRSGSVLLNGRPVRELPGRERAGKISTVMQSAPPALDYTVREYVTIGRGPHLPVFAPPSETDLEKIRTAMERFDVVQFADRTCNSLSGGERQRVMLAAAWANDPEILLLDEPTSATDPAHTLLILKMLKEKSKQTAVFMISHDLLLTAGTVDRLLMMRHGRILAAGTPDEVLTAENIYQLYDIRVRILRTDNGQLAILPEL